MDRDYDDEQDDDYYWYQEREDYFRLIEEDDYWGVEYYDERLAPPSLKDRILYKIYEIKWIITEFWNYKLGMKRCPNCNKRYYFSNHNDCIPF